MKITYPVITAALTSLGIAAGMRIENARQDRVLKENVKEEAVQQDMRNLKHYILVAGNKIEYTEFLLTTEDLKDSEFSRLSNQWHHARIKLTPEGLKLLDAMSKKYPEDALHIE